MSGIDTLRAARVRPTVPFTDAAWNRLAALLALSSRQLDIVRCIFEGCDEQATAGVLQMSKHTVHSHVERVYRKLKIRSRHELVVRVFLVYLSLDGAVDVTVGQPHE